MSMPIYMVYKPALLSWSAIAFRDFFCVCVWRGSFSKMVSETFFSLQAGLSD